MVTDKVLCLFGPPDEESTRSAIARCIALIQRRHAVSLVEIATAGGVHPNTIRLARRRESTLGTEALARLRFYFDPECFEPWERLCRPESGEELTVEERLERIEREAATIRKEIGNA